MRTQPFIKMSIASAQTHWEEWWGERGEWFMSLGGESFTHSSDVGFVYKQSVTQRLSPGKPQESSNFLPVVEE